MNTVYEKAIRDISNYLNIPSARKSVLKAIEELKNHEREAKMENQLETVTIPAVLRKLINENEKKRLEDTEKIKLITHEFLCAQKFGSQHFLQLSDYVYSLKGYGDTVYVFELIFIPDGGVILKRLKHRNRSSKITGYTFDEVPSLLASERRKDEEVLKSNFKGLHMELKRCWEHLNMELSPASSISQNSTQEDVEDLLSQT